MNSIYALDTSYLRSDRTIETILVKRGSDSKMVWIYNFEGIHFRVFEKLLDVHHFLNDATEAQYSFSSEKELDEFLLHVDVRIGGS
jgi:hypothetical protein